MPDIRIQQFDKDDLDILRTLVAEYRRRPKDRPRSDPTPPLPTAPEVYVVLTPDGGIPGLTESADVGTEFGEDDEPGSADCQIYRRVSGVLIPQGFTRTVYNLSADAIGGSQWVGVVRDKWGDWYAMSGVPGPAGAGGGTPFTPTFEGGSIFPQVAHHYPSSTITGPHHVGGIWVQPPQTMTAIGTAGYYILTANIQIRMFPNLSDQYTSSARLRATNDGEAVPLIYGPGFIGGAPDQAGSNFNNGLFLIPYGYMNVPAQAKPDMLSVGAEGTWFIRVAVPPFTPKFQFACLAPCVLNGGYYALAKIGE